MADLEKIFSLPFVSFGERYSLPPRSGIYFVTQEKSILYIGLSKNMHDRWLYHHKIEEISQLSNVNIHYYESKENLEDMEAFFINKFSPPLNRIYPRRKTDRKYIIAQETTSKMFWFFLASLFLFSPLYAYLWLDKPSPFWGYASAMGILLNCFMMLFHKSNKEDNL